MPLKNRGASHWPFIITLLLLLAFVFLWYGQKGDSDKLTQDAVALNAKIGDANKKLTETEDYLDKLTEQVGFAKKSISAEHSKLVSDVDAIAAALNGDKPDSVVKAFRDAAIVTYGDQKYKPAKGVAATSAQIPQLTQAFKDKIKEIRDAAPKSGMPAEPVDTDDAGAVAKYQAEKAAYEEAFAKYNKLINELVKDPQFKDYSAVIGEYGLYDPDKVVSVAWNFNAAPAAAITTLEDFIGMPAGVLKNVVASYIERVSADKKEYDGLVALNAQKDKTISNADEGALGLQEQLKKEQDARSADVQRLQKEAEVARAEQEKLRVSQTAAEQALAQEKEAKKKAVDTLTQANKAMQDNIVGNKERETLKIDRDEVDGYMRGADSALGTGYISLGNQDKVYAGLKFAVSYLGRGAIRMPKGEVVVTKVIDAHYSQVRILSQLVGEKPIAAGDMIHNPFFTPNHTIHLFLGPADLRKYPRTVAAARLERMGVIIQDAIGTNTDYVLIPDTMTAKPGGDAAPAGDAGGAKAETDLDKLSRLAHTFGAALITERLLEAFIDY